jgi:hypothetical protein
MCMLDLSTSDVDGDVRCATRVADFVPSIVHIRFNHSTEPLTIFCLFSRVITGALQINYALERVAAWCRARSKTRRRDAYAHQSRLLAPRVRRHYHQLALIFDDIVNKSMILDFQVLPFQSNVEYDVILAIDTLIQHQLLWMTFRHRFITQPEPATPSDLLAAHISSAEAYNVEGDIPTFTSLRSSLICRRRSTILCRGM